MDRKGEIATLTTEVAWNQQSNGEKINAQDIRFLFDGN